MRRMRVKKKYKIKFRYKFIVYILIMYLSYAYFFSLLVKTKVTINNANYLRIILKDANHSIMTEFNEKKLLSKGIIFLTGINVNEPETITKQTFKIGTKKEALNGIIGVSTEDNDNYEVKKSDYVTDPHPKQVVNPVVYIYNTHQLEEYSLPASEAYNITPNVMLASYLLKEKLNDWGISSVVEEANIKNYLSRNKLSYGKSYQASRYFLNIAKNKHKELDYFIDIHRDAISKERATIRINNINYAKILFVVGLKNKNYEANLNTVIKLNKQINLKYPGLSRGIIKKIGPKVNGLYNQDVSANAILIEVGSNTSLIEEVSNTINVISEILAVNIKEVSNEKK